MSEEKPEILKLIESISKDIAKHMNYHYPDKNFGIEAVVMENNEEVFIKPYLYVDVSKEDNCTCTCNGEYINCSKNKTSLNLRPNTNISWPAALFEDCIVREYCKLYLMINSIDADIN